MNERVLAGQRAIVTGAGTGIGAAVAHGYAEAGAAVLINYFGAGEAVAAGAAAEAIVTAGGRAVAVAGDVSKPEDVEHLFDMAAEHFGGTDIVVANAGLQKDGAFTELSLADWRAALDVDLTGAFLCAQEGVRRFRRQGPDPKRSLALGKVIFTSSVHQIIPWAGHANYAAAKGGVKMLMESMAQELAPEKIRVNAIAPGAIRTAINTPAWSTPEALANLLKLIPYGRIGEGEDIARAAVWLASDASDYVVGTTLFVDGGMSLYPSFAHGG
ncbi:MAG: glucose 1-dehydrogenase [Caulobacteraceae bacterium]